MHADFWQLAVFFFCFVFFPTNMPRFYDWPMKVSLKLPCIFLNISGNIKDHTLQGARVQLGATAIQASAPSLSLLSVLFWLLLQGSCFSVALLREKNSKQGQKRDEEEATSLPAFVSIMCHGRTWLSCSVWLSLLLQPSLSPLSLRGRRRSLHCIHFSSAQLRCSHLADISSSADTSPVHGLSWLTDSCPHR